MDNFDLRKSLLIMFTFSVLFLCSQICRAEETVAKTITSEIDFSFIEPRIEHEPIETVLANGILNAKIVADFGDATSAVAVLEYKIDSGEVIEVTKENVINKRAFYLGTEKGDITDANNVVDYRVKVTFESSEGQFVLYSPVNASSETFSQATVIKRIEGNIDGSTGGAIEVFCGDQSKEEKGTVKVVVPEGAYSGTHQVVVEFLGDNDSSGTVSSQTKEKVISTPSVSVDGVSEINSAIQIENLPLQTETQAGRFYIQYENGSDWEKVSGANLSVDKMYQVYSFDAEQLGNYRIVESISLTDSSYRPDNRIVVKAKVGNSYPGFEFKYLQEGDSITIYNLKGRKVRKITASGSDVTVWDGRKDNGDWAESGTYIYQIKLKSKSDTVSGTIAFVW